MPYTRNGEEPGKVTKPGEDAPDPRERRDADVPSAGRVPHMKPAEEVITCFATRQVGIRERADIDPPDGVRLVDTVVETNFHLADRARAVMENVQYLSFVHDASPEARLVSIA